MATTQPDPYNFDLPAELIARFPAQRRGDARLLVIHYQSGHIEHTTFEHLDNFLSPHDLLVRNKTRVLPARVSLRGQTGKVFDVLFLEHGQDYNRVLLKGARRLKDGHVLRPTQGSGTQGSAVDEAGLYFVFSRRNGDLCLQAFQKGQAVRLDFSFFEKHGTMPIPPYLDRPAAELDKKRYQTVFATPAGETGRSSVAAPTAGLHFSTEHIQRLSKKGIRWAEIQLAIGYGTFAPPVPKNFEEQRLHAEWVEIPSNLNADLQQLQTSGGKLVAVGTTSLRALESAARRRVEARSETGHTATNEDSDEPRLQTGGFETDIFIYPPYRFQIVRNLLTNFHLPSSSLFMLVCALGGTTLVQKAYAEAIKKKYRFFSYGDACLFLDD